MPLTPELEQAYALSKQPYLEGNCCVAACHLEMKSWRYVIEINSHCNLRCALCFAGNQKGYEYHKGVMDMALLNDILDKAKSETPNGGIVCCYANSEPFLHPQLPEVIQAVKRRGFRLELSTNLNYFQRLDEVLASGPDLFTVSVSGFTQPIYERAHRGGDIEKVKQNLEILADLRQKVNPSIFMGVSYHMYRYNLHEVEPMTHYVSSLGMVMLMSWARAINIENTLQCLRQQENCPSYELGPGELDLNKVLPSANPAFMEAMNQISFHPIKAREKYAQWAVSPMCVISDVFCYIRYDGKVQLCAWTDDRHLILGDYLKMTADQISEARRFHPLCKECLRYRLPLYFHLVQPEKFNLE